MVASDYEHREVPTPRIPQQPHERLPDRTLRHSDDHRRLRLPPDRFASNAPITRPENDSSAHVGIPFALRRNPAGRRAACCATGAKHGSDHGWGRLVPARGGVTDEQSNEPEVAWE